MRTAVPAVVAAALLLAGCGGGSQSTVETGNSMGMPAPSPAHRKLSSVAMTRRAEAQARRLAVGDARRRLAAASLPPDSSRVAGLPKSLGLDYSGREPEQPNLVTRHALYVTSVDEAEALAWFRSHPPAGVAETRGHSEGEYIFTFPNLESRVTDRWLTLTTAPRPGGGTAMRVEAQGYWVTPHPSGETIPRSARVVALGLNVKGLRKATAVVTDRAEVAAFARLIDRMSAVQPGAFGCEEAGAYPPKLVFTFSVTRAGAPVATAGQELPPGCGRLFHLTIGGAKAPSLAGSGALDRRALKRLGVKPGAAG